MKRQSCSAILVIHGKQVKQRIYSWLNLPSGCDKRMSTSDFPSSPAPDGSVPESAGDFVQRVISDPQRPLVMFGVDYCEFCWAARKLLDTLEVSYEMIDLGAEEFQAGNRGREIRRALQALTGSPTTPQIFISGTWIGGATDMFDEYKEGSFQKLLHAARLSFISPSDLDPYSLLQHHHFKL
jgi:cysteine synthase A